MCVQKDIRHNAINGPRECKGRNRRVLVKHECKEQVMTDDKEFGKPSQLAAVSLSSSQTSSDDS